MLKGPNYKTCPPLQKRGYIEKIAITHTDCRNNHLLRTRWMDGFRQ